MGPSRPHAGAVVAARATSLHALCARAKFGRQRTATANMRHFAAPACRDRLPDHDPRRPDPPLHARRRASSGRHRRRTRRPGVDRRRHDTVDDPPALLASLRQLMHLRSIAIVGQAAALAVALALGVVLRVVPMVVILGALVLLNVLVSARLKRGTPATHREVAVHLARRSGRVQRAAAPCRRHRQSVRAPLSAARRADRDAAAVAAGARRHAARGRELRPGRSSTPSRCGGPTAGLCPTPRWHWVSGRASR